MVKKNFFKFLILVILAFSALFLPATSILKSSELIKQFFSVGDELKTAKLERDKSKEFAKSAEDSFISARSTDINPYDPVVVSQLISGLEGVTVTKINALSIDDVPAVVGEYSPDANQWCDGLEFHITATDIENTLLRIDKMELVVISTVTKAPNKLILQIQTKGVQ